MFHSHFFSEKLFKHVQCENLEYVLINRKQDLIDIQNINKH